MILTLLFPVLEREKLLITSTTAVSAFRFAQLFISSTEKCITWCTEPQSQWRFLHIYVIHSKRGKYGIYHLPSSLKLHCVIKTVKRMTVKSFLCFSALGIFISINLFLRIEENITCCFIIKFPFVSAGTSDFSLEISQKQLG